MTKIADIRPDVLAELARLSDDFERNVLAKDMLEPEIANQSDEWKAGYMKGRREGAAAHMRLEFQKAGLLLK